MVSRVTSFVDKKPTSSQHNNSANKNQKEQTGIAILDLGASFISELKMCRLVKTLSINWKNIQLKQKDTAQLFYWDAADVSAYQPITWTHEQGKLIGWSGVQLSGKWCGHGFPFTETWWSDLLTNSINTKARVHTQYIFFSFTKHITSPVCVYACECENCTKSLNYKYASIRWRETFYKQMNNIQVHRYDT